MNNDTNPSRDKFVIDSSTMNSINNTANVQNTNTVQNNVVQNTVQNVGNTTIPSVQNNVVQNTTIPSVETTTIPNVQNTTSQMPNDPNAMVNENLKKVEINYTPPSKFKVVILVLFFIALLGFIIFLPEVTAFINNFMGGEENIENDVINSGKLKCSLSTNTTNLDKNYDLTFRFTDNKLEKTEFIITTKGDITLDEETLDGLAKKCNQLKENVKDIQGVVIQCNYSDGKLEEIQSFDLAVVDGSKLDAAFTEAGGNNPEYQNGQDVNMIERTMKASGYTCKRER